MKRRLALLESNLPRNSRLELIEADEGWEWAKRLTPGCTETIGSIDSLMPEKTHTCPFLATCARKLRSNSTGER